MEKVKFKNLEELYLSGNQISDIKVFENAKFEKLKILNLLVIKLIKIIILHW